LTQVDGAQTGGVLVVAAQATADAQANDVTHGVAQTTVGAQTVGVAQIKLMAVMSKLLAMLPKTNGDDAQN